MKKLLITLLKVGISIAIIAYLVYDATQSKAHGNVFANLCNEPKQWGMLAAAWACCIVAVLLTFIRWWYLVIALDIPCRFRDAIRISFWGYLFNLAPLGIIGGDVIKAVMLGHEHQQHRAKALASVVADRVIGLYILFVVASTAILLTSFWNIPGMWWICKTMFILTIAGTVGLAVVLGPDWAVGWAVRMIGRIPRVGHHLESLIDAVRMYNRKPVVLIVSSLMTVAVHLSFAVGCYLIACGLPGNHLSLANHLVVMPIGSAMGVIPLAAGPLEWAVDFFYAHVPVAGAPIPGGQGLAVALTYRIITVLIAALGTFYYFRNRREMTEVIHEAEQEEPA